MLPQAVRSAHNPDRALSAHFDPDTCKPLADWVILVGTQEHSMYDPEAIYQDADIEMWEMQDAANHNHRLEQQGKCGHHSWVGLPDSGKIYYPEQENLKGDEVACTDGCGRKFSDEEALFMDRAEHGFM